MKYLLSSLCFIFVLSGCNSSGRPYHNNGYDSYQLKLLYPLTVAAGSSHVYITAPGKVVNRSEIGTYELYCKFSVPRPKHSDELVISAGVFRIKNIYARGPLVFHSPGNQQLAYYGQYSRFFNHHEVSKQELELHFEIISETQPEIKLISCVRFSDPYPENVPTLHEAREVFRGLMQFSS